MADDLSSLKAQVLQLNGQLQGLAAVVQTLQTRLMANGMSNSPDPVSGYSIFPSQQVTQFSHIDLYNFVFTNQTAPGTSVSWSQGYLIYQGVTYPIAAGSAAAASSVIYWQIANPFVFQTSGVLPALGRNDFLIGFNSPNSSGTLGFFQLLEDLHNSVGDRIVIKPDGIFQVNPANKLVYSLARSGAGNNSGFFVLGDGLGGVAMQFDINNRITLNSGVGAIAVTNPSNDSFQVVINGVTRNVPVY